MKQPSASASKMYVCTRPALYRGCEAPLYVCAKPPVYRGFVHTHAHFSLPRLTLSCPREISGNNILWRLYKDTLTVYYLYYADWILANYIYWHCTQSLDSLPWISKVLTSIIHYIWRHHKIHYVKTVYMYIYVTGVETGIRNLLSSSHTAG